MSEVKKYASGILQNLMSAYSNCFPKNSLEKVAKYANLESIQDSEFCKNRSLLKYLNPTTISNKKIMRLIIRDESVLDYTNISEFNLSVKEISKILSAHPHLQERLPIDYENLQAEDIYLLAMVGDMEIFDKINFKQADLNFKQTLDIIKEFGYNKKVVMNMDSSIMKHYQICEIIIRSDDTFYFDEINYECLTAKNWLEILRVKPDLYILCDLEIFSNCDVMYAIELLILFPNENNDFLLSESRMKTISALGWEKLLSAFGEKYVDYCDFSKLNQANWNNILMCKPNLAVYKF